MVFDNLDEVKHNLMGKSGVKFYANMEIFSIYSFRLMKTSINLMRLKKAKPVYRKGICAKAESLSPNKLNSCFPNPKMAQIFENERKWHHNLK